MYDSFHMWSTGFTMALEQPKNSVSSMQQGFIAQNTFVPQQVLVCHRKFNVAIDGGILISPLVL